MNKFKVGDVAKFGIQIIKIIEIYQSSDYFGNWYKVKNLQNGTIGSGFRDGDLKPYNFTKSDLKDNHIVEFKGGEKQCWNGWAQEWLNEDLTDAYCESYDIIKVYEFDKLVYDRSWFENECEEKREILKPKNFDEYHTNLRVGEEKIEKIGNLYSTNSIVDNVSIFTIHSKLNELVDEVNKLNNDLKNYVSEKELNE